MCSGVLWVVSGSPSTTGSIFRPCTDLVLVITSCINVGTLYRQWSNPLNALETPWEESFLGHEKSFSDNLSPASDRSPDKLSEENRQKFDLLKTSQMSWNMCERTLWHTLSMLLEHLETKKVSRIICPRPRINYPRVSDKLSEENSTRFELYKCLEICVNSCSHTCAALPSITQSSLNLLLRKVPGVPNKGCPTVPSPCPGKG